MITKSDNNILAILIGFPATNAIVMIIMAAALNYYGFTISNPLAFAVVFFSALVASVIVCVYIDTYYQKKV